MNADDKIDGLYVYKRRLWGALAHAFCLWVTVAISYNSYKAAVKGHAPLSREMRDSIQSAFPWAVIIFLALYLVFMAASRTQGRLLSAKHYLYAGAIYLGLTNILFLKKGRAALIILDSSAFLFVFTLILLSWAFGFAGGLTADCGHAKRPSWFFVVITGIGGIYGRLGTRLAAFFTGAAVFLILLSSVLLFTKQAKPALNTAYVSFILLAAGVGIEVYNLVCGPKRD
ncbi:MAG: hypothetical protein HY887_10245 [Deltaproteobacteria bacterium]|nr:hypothetical protein [Deltaproteobacteria bacterium]